MDFYCGRAAGARKFEGTHPSLSLSLSLSCQSDDSAPGSWLGDEPPLGEDARGCLTRVLKLEPAACGWVVW